MAPHPSTLAWKIPWMEEPGRLHRPWGRKVSDTTERLHSHFSLSCIGEGSGNPLQCSCLENPRDGGAWWGAVYGIAQSQTRLKRLSSSSSSRGSLAAASFPGFAAHRPSLPSWNPLPCFSPCPGRQGVEAVTRTRTRIRPGPSARPDERAAGRLRVRESRSWPGWRA